MPSSRRTRPGWGGLELLSENKLVWENFSQCFNPSCDRLVIVAKLAEKFPDLTIVLNHLGTKVADLRAEAEAGSEEFDHWRACMAPLKALPNVYVKLGGTGQHASGGVTANVPHHMAASTSAAGNAARSRGPLTSEQMLERHGMYRWYKAVLDDFGADRCMFESNFPVDKECGSSVVLWNFFKRVAAKAGLSEDSKQQAFAGTARKVYRLR